MGTQGIDTTTSIGRMVYGQLAVFAEFEREQISDRTKAGMAAAKRRGKHVGRPPKLTPAQVAHAAEQIKQKKQTISAMADVFGVAHHTLARAVKEHRVA